MLPPHLRQVVIGQPGRPGRRWAAGPGVDLRTPRRGEV